MALTGNLANAGVPMEQALSPDECDKMRRFLWVLVWAAGKCYRAGRTPDVAAFIRVWAGKEGVRGGLTRQERARRDGACAAGSAGG